MANRLVNGKVVEMTSAEEAELTNARNKANEFQTAWDNVDEEKLTELNVKIETINKLKKSKSDCIVAKPVVQSLSLGLDLLSSCITRFA